MSEIKTNIVEQLMYFLQKLHINDNNNQDYKHTIICGPPGTGKTDIADDYAMIKEGKKYKVHGYWFRLPLMSWFPKIYKYKEV